MIKAKIQNITIFLIMVLFSCINLSNVTKLKKVEDSSRNNSRKLEDIKYKICNGKRIDHCYVCAIDGTQKCNECDSPRAGNECEFKCLYDIYSSDEERVCKESLGNDSYNANGRICINFGVDDNSSIPNGECVKCPLGYISLDGKRCVKCNIKNRQCFYQFTSSFTGRNIGERICKDFEPDNEICQRCPLNEISPDGKKCVKCTYNPDNKQCTYSSGNEICRDFEPDTDGTCQRCPPDKISIDGKNCISSKENYDDGMCDGFITNNKTECYNRKVSPFGKKCCYITVKSNNNGCEEVSYDNFKNNTFLDKYIESYSNKFNKFNNLECVSAYLTSVNFAFITLLLLF